MPADVAYVDLIDACHLKCPTCVRGVRAIKNTGRRMSMETFEKVAAKIKSEGYRRVGFYSWTEPFLNRNLAEYVRAGRKEGLTCQISSTLSLRRIDHLEDVLRAGVHLTVSMSGVTQDVYERNHVGGTLEYVFANLDRIAAAGLTSDVCARFIRFDYNAHQADDLAAWAQCRGFDFELVEGIGHPKQLKFFAQHTPEFFDDRIATVTDPPPKPENVTRVCSLMFDQLALDCEGIAYLCCAWPTHAPLQIGPYLELSKDELLRRRYQHPFCGVCEIPRRPATDADRAELTQALSAEDGFRKVDRATAAEPVASVADGGSGV